MKRKMKLSRYFVSLTMLPSAVAWLSFSVFNRSLKVENENCNQFSIFVFGQILSNR